MAGRRLQRLPGTRVEPAPNSEYAPISEMRLITRDYGKAAVNSHIQHPYSKEMSQKSTSGM